MLIVAISTHLIAKKDATETLHPKKNWYCWDVFHSFLHSMLQNLKKMKDLIMESPKTANQRTLSPPQNHEQQTTTDGNRVTCGRMIMWPLVERPVSFPNLAETSNKAGNKRKYLTSLLHSSTENHSHSRTSSFQRTFLGISVTLHFLFYVDNRDLLCLIVFYSLRKRCVFRGSQWRHVEGCTRISELLKSTVLDF